MNTQIRFTPVDDRENRLQMQAIQHQAEQDALARPPADGRPARLHTVGWALHGMAHGLWLAGDELALELADVLHGHRPHRHHHAH
jgi:hypothetical protein